MMFAKGLIIIVLVCASVLSTGTNAECGYKSCNPVEENIINIHLVPHSHDDLGYVKTVEQYYYGVHDDYQNAGVQYILDSVVEALQKNVKRRFVQVETGFFWKWWLEQDDETKDIVKELVNNGQLEFIGGGWSMNDEAITYYQTIIDQMTWGLRKLNETFGECGRPRVAWQIDPFGHSREMASIFAQMGYDGFFLNRIDYQDLALRTINGSLEFVWRGNPDNLGAASDIYTNIFFNHYNAPSGLCFDVSCSDAAVVDNPNSTEYNVNTKAENFINDWVRPALQGYASNNVLVPMGGDFNYQYAEKYYKNMDKLIRYMNGREFNGTKFNVLYSTPSCYLKAVYQATNGTLNAPLKTDDFFPYASSAHNYWTGYYSSRPNGKRYSTYANNFLQICKQLSSFSNITSYQDSRLDSLRESLATFQHHDGITGTERQHVADDYNRMLYESLTKCEEVVDNIFPHFIKSWNMTFTTCPKLNISECVKTETEDKLIITVYNPLGKPVDRVLRIPIPDNTSNYIITDPEGDSVDIQIIPLLSAVLNIPGRNSSAEFELAFLASNLPGLGFKSYYFERISEETNKANSEMIYFEDQASLQQYLKNIYGVAFGHYFAYYNGNNGNYTAEEFSPSQPYVFRPDPNNPVTEVYNGGSRLYSGPVVLDVQRYDLSWLSSRHSIRSSPTFDFEVAYVAGPLPYNSRGVELALGLNIESFDHDGSFYTDTNGRGSIHRVKDQRPTWNVSIAEPEAGNYYPASSRLIIKSIQEDLVITMLPDRGLGVTSPEKEKIEFMIHRNTMSGGPGKLAESLNEQAYGQGIVTTGLFFYDIRYGDFFSQRDAYTEEKALNLTLNSWMFFSSPNGLSFEQYKVKHVMEFSALKTPLPRHGHILTLEPWGPSQLLLRLENFVGNDNQFAEDISINVKELFSTFDVIAMRETTLGGNQWLEDNVRIRFNDSGNSSQSNTVAENDFIVDLTPLEIRTFVLEVVYK